VSSTVFAAIDIAPIEIKGPESSGTGRQRGLCRLPKTLVRLPSSIRSPCPMMPRLI